MNNKKLVFVSVYCQNDYQEDRIRNFVKSQDSKIINPHFNTNVRINPHYKNGLVSRADEVWILIGSLDSDSPENKIKMHTIEDYSIKLNKPLKYFYIYQSGSNVGKTKPLDRQRIFNSDFYSFLQEENK